MKFALLFILLLSTLCHGEVVYQELSTLHGQKLDLVVKKSDISGFLNNPEHILNLNVRDTLQNMKQSITQNFEITDIVFKKTHQYDVWFAIITISIENRELKCIILPSGELLHATTPN